jgi:hypothetical protein
MIGSVLLKFFTSPITLPLGILRAFWKDSADSKKRTHEAMYGEGGALGRGEVRGCWTL